MKMAYANKKNMTLRTYLCRYVILSYQKCRVLDHRPKFNIARSHMLLMHTNPTFQEKISNAAYHMP